jgi:hypothetical protein
LPADACKDLRVSFPAAEPPPPDQPYPPAPARTTPGEYTWAPPPVAPGRNWRRELLIALGVAAVASVLGIPLGLLWTRYAPHPHKIVLYDYALYNGDERLIAGEGWYVFASLVTGLVLAVLAWVVLRRYRGPIVLLGLAIGGIAGGAIMYGTGHHVGAAHANDLLTHSPPGTDVRMPVDLGAQRVGLWHGWIPFVQGDVLCIAIAAVLVYLVLAGFSAYPTLRPPTAAEIATGEVSSDY